MSTGNWVKKLRHRLRAFVQNSSGDTIVSKELQASSHSSSLAGKRQLALNFKKLGDDALQKRDFLNSYANYKNAIASDPSYANPYNNLAVTYLIFGYGTLDEALAAVKRCIELDPSIDQSYQNLAYLLLLKGDYTSGWEVYEQRLVQAKNKKDVSQKNICAALNYFGEEKYLRSIQQVAGKKIVIWAEQGLGDFIMGFRYLASLKQLGCTNLILLTMPELATLSQTQDCVDQVILEPGAISTVEFDFHCSIMSLFSLFHEEQRSSDKAILFPYLKIQPPAAHLTIPKTRAKVLVGITWHGNPQNALDYLRSIDTNQITALLKIENVEWISLQKEAEQNQGNKQLTPNLNWTYIDRCTSLEETAQLISQLDLVITVDTSIAHLAGALGKKTWLLNRYQSEWRWGIETEETRWYPSMTIFRQRELYDWLSVLEQVKVRLEIPSVQEN